MKNRVRFFFLFLGLLGALAVHAQINELPRSTPEAEGVPSKAVTALFDSLMALPKTDIHSVVVLRHGKVIGEIYPAPFAPEYRHTMYSCSKTFVGAAVGLAIADNRLRLTDRVAAFFPEFLPDYQNLDELKDHYKRGGLGDVKVKKFLNNVLQAELGPIRERRKMWEQRIPDVYDILREGSKVAEAKAAETLRDVKASMKINYFDDDSLIQ